jgi:HlyD family secretion protein
MSKNVKRIVWGAGILLVIIILAKVFGNKNAKIEVTFEKSTLRSIVETVSASGKIQPETEVKIQSEVSGQIVELPVKEGDLVQKGQLLVRINPDLYTSALNRAEAAVNSAKSNLSSAKARLTQAEAQLKSTDLSYERQKKLFEDGAISKSELDAITGQWETAKAEVVAGKESIHSAEFAIESSQAGLNEAADNLKRTTIMAPMTGTVTALNKELGETVLGNSMMSGDVIMKVSALDFMEVNVEVNESDIVRVGIGDTVLVEVDSYKDEEFKGVVTEIGNTALNALAATLSMDQVTNFSVKIRILPQSYQHLMMGNAVNYSPFKPGMSATVEIITERASDVLTVPIKAVASREDTSSTTIGERFRKKSESGEIAENEDEAKEPFEVLFVLNEATGKAELRVVETGIQDDKYIQIKSGIQRDEQVITGPYEQVSRKLKNGDEVTKKVAKSAGDNSENSKE